MRLWDGMKRLWSWIKKGIRKIVSFGKNMLRGFYRFAMRAHTMIRTAFSAFARSMDQYMTGQLDLDGDNPIQVLIKKDMDNQVLLPGNIKPGDVTGARSSIERFGSMFFFSCHIISLFVDVLKAVVKGVTGWARLLLVLVKSFRDLVPAYRQLKQIM